MDQHNGRISLDEGFYQYMLSELQLSLEQSKRIENRADRSVDVFLGSFTALIGGAIAVILTIKEHEIKVAAVGLILFIASVGGSITYTSLLSSIVKASGERITRYFLHRYFRDIDPGQFSKYGRDTVLNNHANALFSKNNFGFVRRGILAVLMFSTCAVFSGSVYAGWIVLTGTKNLILSVGAGIVLCLFLVAIWIRAAYRLNKLAENGHAVLMQYGHSNVSTTNQNSSIPVVEIPSTEQSS